MLKRSGEFILTRLCTEVLDIIAKVPSGTSGRNKRKAFLKVWRF
jgi:hypothetical protein